MSKTLSDTDPLPAGKSPLVISGVAPGSQEVADAPLSLGQATTQGFVWLLAQTLGAKVAAILGQILLARLLMPDDFGLIGLALTVTSFASIFQQGGMQLILIQRQTRFDELVHAAFWLSLCLGFAALAAALAAAPVAARVYHSGELAGLVGVAACAQPFNALNTVPMAILQIRMRFRALSLVTLFSAILTTVLTVLFAFLGFHAYSFVVPILLVAAGRAAALWLLVEARPALRFDFALWRPLLSTSGLLLGTAVCALVCSQGDYLILGLFQSKVAVGVYFFAFNLSTQTIGLLTGNLLTAIFPALSKLQHDAALQTNAFVRAATLLGIFSIPVCLLQAALAEPLIGMLFGPKWFTAVPILQILSVGMALSLNGSMAAGLSQAQGRFRFLFRWTALTAVSFLLFVLAGACTRSVAGMALAVSAFYFLFGPLGTYLAIKPGGGKAADLLKMYFLPMVGSCLTLTPVFAVGEWMPSIGVAKYLIMAGLVFAAAVGYLGFIRRFAPAELHDLFGRIRSLWLAAVQKTAHIAA